MKCVYWTEVVDSDQEYLLKNVKNVRGHILEIYKLNVIIIIMFLKEVTYAHKLKKINNNFTKNTMKAVKLWNINTI